jgi:hypothetical protein
MAAEGRGIRNVMDDDHVKRRGTTGNDRQVDRKDTRPPQKGHDGQRTVLEKTSGSSAVDRGFIWGDRGSHVSQMSRGAKRPTAVGPTCAATRIIPKWAKDCLPPLGGGGEGRGHGSSGRSMRRAVRRTTGSSEVRIWTQWDVGGVGFRGEAERKGGNTGRKRMTMMSPEHGARNKRVEARAPGETRLEHV